MCPYHLRGPYGPGADWGSLSSPIPLTSLAGLARSQPCCTPEPWTLAQPWDQPSGLSREWALGALSGQQG